jgi:hypothetical protein
MAQVLTKAMDRNVEATLSLLNDIVGTSQLPDVAVRLWNGATWRPESATGEPTRCTVVLQAPGRTPQDVGAANRSASRRGIHLQ